MAKGGITIQLTNIGTVKKLMSDYGINFSRALGQNFLVNPNVCPKMAEYAVPDSDTCVIEIGPGIGVLTSELAKRAKKVVAIEIDEKLLPVLNETLSEYNNVKLIRDDILNIDLNEIISKEFGDCRVCVCANLPYYITSQIIMKILESKFPVETAVLMVQREVAERICAKPGERNVGAITISALYYAEPELLFRVSKGSFMPIPKVSSAVIRLNVRKSRVFTDEQERIFKKIVKYVFAQRRKTILNSLSSGFDLPKNITGEILSVANIQPSLRAEHLELNDYIRLTLSMKEYFDQWIEMDIGKK